MLAAHLAEEAVAAHPNAREIPLTVDKRVQSSLEKLAAARAALTKTDAAAVRKRIEAILDDNASAPLLGLAGEPLVNVLEVNLRLDADLPTQ